MKKKIKTRLISCIMVGIMMSLNLAIVKADTNQFNDITSYYPYNNWAAETGKKHSLIFLENNNRECKRYEIASLLYHLLDLGISKENSKFYDLDVVDTNNRNKINAIAEANIISGYADGCFKPNNNVTRAEFVTMLDRSGLLKKSNKTTNTPKFSDIENHWAKNSIEYVSSLGLIAGKGNNQFCPDSSITPQEILIIADRMIDIGCIADTDLLTAMQNTFKCKQYSKKEKYIPEVIFNDFDTIQRDMSIYRHSLSEYNYSDIGSLVTLEDVLTWRYYYDRGDTAIRPFCVERTIDEDSKYTYFKNGSKYHKGENGNQEIHYYFGLENENVNYSRPVTINEFLVALYSHVEEDVSNVKVSFPNFNEFTEEEKHAIKKMIYWGILPDSEYEFPGNEYMTKALLNYITIKINSLEDIYIYSHYYLKKDMYSIDKDEDNWPNNAEKYPFIVRPIDNEAYEIPFINADNELSRTPQEAYYDSRRYYSSIKSYSERYFNTILNVDYNTISSENFTTELEGLFMLPQRQEEFDKYIQYVKDNKIILKGIVESYLPIFYYDGAIQNYKLRIKVKFNVVNSETNKNIVFGDLVYSATQNYGEKPKDKSIVYAGNEFELYVDMPFTKFYRDSMKVDNIFTMFLYQTGMKKGNIRENIVEPN